MVSAVEKLPEASATADVESADAFRGVEFVAGERKQIDTQCVDVDGDFSGRLDSVGVEINFVFLGDAADFFERLNCAQLVVGLHDGDENGFGANSLADGPGIDLAFLIDWQVSDVCPLLFQGLAGVKDGFVFDSGGDQMGRRMGN